MKVTIYTNTPYPYGYAGTNRLHQIAKGFLLNDVDVEIIISQPTETKSNIKNKFNKGTFENVSYRYILNTTIRHSNFLVRKIIDLFSFVKVLFHILINESKSDFFIVIGGATFDYRNIIPYITKLTRKKIFLELNEYPFVTHKEGNLKKFKQYFFFNHIIAKYDGIIVISDGLKYEIAKHISNPENKTIKIPILFDPIIEVNNNEKRPIKDPYLIHAGSLIDDKDGIISVLKAFSKFTIQNSNYKFVIAGNLKMSIDQQKIIKFIETEKISDKVIFIGDKTKNELYFYLRHASFAVVNKPDNIQNRYGFNTKISEYIYHNIPLILSNVGENVIYFKNNFNALIVTPNCIDEIVSAMQYIVSNKKLSEQFAKNAFQLLKNDFNPKHNINIFLKKFIDS